jgi:hypothetical protein
MGKNQRPRERLVSQQPNHRPSKTFGAFAWEFMSKYGFHALAFAAGCLITAYNYVSNVATKPYVDEGVKTAIHYTDAKAEQVKREAFDHSDRNHDDMLLRVEQMKTDLKSDLKEQSGKLDMLLDRIHTERRPR